MTLVRHARQTGGEDVRVRVVRAEDQPFLTSGDEVVLGERVLPHRYQFRDEAHLPVHLLIGGGVHQVDDAGADRRLQHLGRQEGQMALARRESKMAGIDHLVERLDIVDVRGAPTVHVARRAAVRLAVLVEVGEVHPHADLGCAPDTRNRIVGVARPGVHQVADHVRGMRHISDVEDAQAGLPVGAVDVRVLVAGVVGIGSGPGLHGHVMDVDPTATGGLPRHLRLPHLDDARQVTVAGEIEVRDGDAATRLTGPDVALVVVRIGDEDVPLAVHHVGVEVVRT